MMDDPPRIGQGREAQPGLCADCQHARRVENERGSVFWLCDLSRTDARFPRYPRLPVTVCAGFEQTPPPAA
jgi:hypothetical protein